MPSLLELVNNVSRLFHPTGLFHCHKLPFGGTHKLLLVAVLEVLLQVAVPVTHRNECKLAQGMGDMRNGVERGGMRACVRLGADGRQNEEKEMVQPCGTSMHQDPIHVLCPISSLLMSLFGCSQNG